MNMMGVCGTNKKNVFIPCQRMLANRSDICALPTNQKPKFEITTKFGMQKKCAHQMTVSEQCLGVGYEIKRVSPENQKRKKGKEKKQ